MSLLSDAANPPEELSGSENLRKALSESFTKDLSSHYCSYVGMAAFRTLFHYLIRKKEERLRLSKKVVAEWEAFVRVSFKGRLEALRSQYTQIPLSGSAAKEDLGAVVDSSFEESMAQTKREIEESLQEPGTAFLEAVKRGAPKG